MAATINLSKIIMNYHIMKIMHIIQLNDHTIEMLHEMDDMACLALLGRSKTPGLQSCQNFLLEIF